MTAQKHNDDLSHEQKILAEKYARYLAKHHPLFRHLHERYMAESGEGDTARAGSPQQHAKDSGRWVTIGGHPEGDKQHAGGVRVMLDASGRIVASSAPGLQGKHVSEVGGQRMAGAGSSTTRPVPTKATAPSAPGNKGLVGGQGVRSERFKGWFGDWESDPAGASKVIDKRGEPEQNFVMRFVSKLLGHKSRQGELAPVPVYHGTPAGGFDRFSKQNLNPASLYGPAFYFTNDKTVAESYADPKQPGQKASNPEVGSYFLNIRRPFDVDSVKDLDEAKDLIRKIGSPLGKPTIEAAIRTLDQERAEGAKHLTPGDAVYGTLSSALFHRHVNDDQLSPSQRNENLLDVKRQVNELLRKAGYDGIAHTGGLRLGEKKHKVWIAFEPTQIKSTENKGTFDANDERFRYIRQRDHLD